MSNVDQYDPFKGETGLKDDYDGTVTDAVFGMNDRDQMVLYLTVTPDDGDEPQELRYSIGAGWNTYDGGESVENEKDTAERPRAFNNRTNVFELIQASFACGAEGPMRDRSMSQFNNRGPRIAAFWKDWRFHWTVKSEDITIKDRDTKEDKTITMTRSLPTAFLGTGAGDVAPAGSATASPSTQTAPPAPPAASVPSAPPAAPVNSPVATPPTQPAASPASVPEPATHLAQPAPAPVAAPTPEQAAAAVNQPAPAPAAETAVPYGLDQGTWARLKILAATNEFGPFVDQVLSLDNGALVGNNELIAALSSEAGLYGQLRA